MLRPFEAIARFHDSQPLRGEVLALNQAGLTLRLDGPAPKARHLWLHFGLPDGSGACLALGELLESREDRLRVRFKHLFPDARRALHAALAHSDRSAQVA